MDQFFTFSFLTNYLTTAKEWLVNYVLVSSTLLQGTAIFCTLLLALLIRQTIKRKVSTVAAVTENRFTHLLHFLISHLFPLCWLGLQLFVLAIAARLKWPHELLKAATSLLAVWVVIDLTSSTRPKTLHDGSPIAQGVGDRSKRSRLVSRKSIYSNNLRY